VIRLFGLRDILMLRQLEAQGVGFDLRQLLLYSPSPVRSALVGYLTHYQLGTITCVHEGKGKGDGGNLRGFAQAWPRTDQAEWDLAFLAPALDEHRNAPDLWYRLLTYMIILGAEQGALRIYARMSEDAEAEDLFRQAGFTVLSREEIFALPREVSPAPAPKGLRWVMPQDRWALEELYRQVVPQLVQQAEGFSPHWGMTHRRVLASSAPAHEYVWTEKGQIVAYLGLCNSPRGHWLEIVVRPEYRAETLPSIKYMLTLAKCSAKQPIYCPVPDYDVGLGWLLRTLGFESYTRQVLLVAHTVARVPVRRPLIVPTLERSVNIRTPAARSQVGRS
jgi:hypothetical protein